MKSSAKWRKSKLHISKACSAVVESIAHRWFYRKFRRKPRNKTELTFAFTYWLED